MKSSPDCCRSLAEDGISLHERPALIPLFILQPQEMEDKAVMIQEWNIGKWILIFRKKKDEGEGEG